MTGGGSARELPVRELPTRELLGREAGSLVQRLRLWTPARFAAAAADAAGLSRADVVHHLAQSLVDVAGEAPVALPRLDSDLLLPDQLAVAADDLVRTNPAAAVAAAAVAHLLLHRSQLLGEPVPAALVASLGEAGEQELLESARARCALHTGHGRPPSGSGGCQLS